MLKEIWIENEFEIMGWHDCRIYAIKLVDEKFNLSLDIDYIFRWIKSEKGFDGFDVSPCVITFFNVANLKIDLNYGQNLLCFISDIRRKNKRSSPNGNFIIWDYDIECDIGSVSFSATGFEQKIKSVPVRSKSQDLNRENLVIR